LIAPLHRQIFSKGEEFVPFSGIDGFLGTRASLMLDLVAVAMLAVLPVLGWSIALVKYRRNFALHKRIQLALGGVLLVTVLAFEADMRINGWRQRAEASYFWANGTAINWVDCALAVHLFFASTTALLWTAVIVRAWMRFPNPPAPGAHSAWHCRWGKLAAIDLLLTSLTGWLFYWLAFVA